ncbi:amidoligase family protein [bacterium]|nr:amidoligase family protein [bacterium]
MKATWFENKELITLYTDPAYFGADVPDSYQQRPSKPVPVKSLFGYEPSSKMDDIHHKDEVLQIALKMKAGTWKGLPIVCRKDPKGYQVLDGHHRMHAARKAGIDTLDAVIVDREDIEYSDEVKEQRIAEASGYIPTAAQANDPRFKTALTVDVRPGEDQRNIEKLGLNLNMDLVNKTKPGKKRKKTLAESLMEQYQAIKEEDLLEVDMSPSALRSWAKSDEAKGVRAGFELELVLANTQNTDDDDYEADMDADEPIGTLDEIVDFYDGPSGMGAWTSDQRTTEEQFREAVIEDLMEYEDEQFFDWWSDNGEDQVREEMEAELERNVTDEEFMEEFENEGEIFERVREREQDEHRGDITWAQFWESQQIETMGDLMNKYDLYFPYTAGSEGGDKSLDEWAEEISAVTGKGTNISYQYHGSDKESGKYTLEPDSSITADESEDAGIELVSPVMPLDEAIDQLGKLFDWIEEQDGDIYTNSTTGLHMNISVPQGDDIDYTKLVLFSGDKYVLDKYNRLATNYAPSVLTQLQNRASQMNADDAAGAMSAMKISLQDAAEEYVQGDIGMAKYSSIHVKDGYIEFRGPGGVYTNKSFGENMNTMLRFARAMTIAADPQAYKQEYQKKLYKLLNTGRGEERTIDSLFAELQAGTINQQVFKKRWANLVVKQQQNQAILNRLDDKPDDKRLAKAKQLQKDLGGPVKEWTYTIPYTRADGTSTVMIRNVKASSAQLANQAAVQDALDMFDHPQFKTHKPDFNKLNVMLASVEDQENFKYRVPYTTAQNRLQYYEGEIKAEDADKARDQVIKAAQKYFAQNTAFTPNYIDTDIISLDA